jgi:hypothetical protein
MTDKDKEIERLKSVLFVINQLAIVDFIDDIERLSGKAIGDFSIPEHQFKAILDEIKSS